MKNNQKANPFDLSAIYYDLLYTDKNYLAESLFTDRILKSYNPAARKLLELGCGSGTHSTHFSRLGYEITGLDRSSEMIKRARAKVGQQFTGVVADISSFHLHAKFDAAFALFHVISYLTDTEKVLSCFQQVEQHLIPGGIFLFDVWFTPAVCFLQPETRVKEVADNDFTISRKAVPVIDDEKNTVTVNYHFTVSETATAIVRTTEEVHIMRHFSTPEIALFAQLSGFDIIDSIEMLTGNQPSRNTWSVCYVLQKKL